MQTYRVELKSEISDTFRAKKAKDSVDLNEEEKAFHKFSVNADVDTDFNIGLIVGASGSGKTTLAKKLYGDNFDNHSIDNTVAIIDQINEELSYSDAADLLSKIGLSQVPCWVKPAGCLSNGQKERAKIAKAVSFPSDLYVFDEWTSVVDRNVAAVMSHSIQKMARRDNKKFVLVTCHYDVMEWLLPDWVIDCNKQTYTDYRKSPIDRKKKLFSKSEKQTGTLGSCLVSITI
jgi:ABC-type ATPase with predicted acetyltransferase domain